MSNALLSSQFMPEIGAEELDQDDFLIYAAKRALGKAQEDVIGMFNKAKWQINHAKACSQERKIMILAEMIKRDQALVKQAEIAFESASDKNIDKFAAQLSLRMDRLARKEADMIRRQGLLNSYRKRAIAQQSYKHVSRAGAPKMVAVIPGFSAVYVLEMSKQERRKYAWHILINDEMQELAVPQLVLAYIMDAPQAVIHELEQAVFAAYGEGEAYGIGSLIASRPDAPVQEFSQVIQYEARVRLARPFEHVSLAEINAWEMINGSPDGYARCSLEGYARKIVESVAYQRRGKDVDGMFISMLDGFAKQSVKDDPFDLFSSKASRKPARPDGVPSPHSEEWQEYAKAYGEWSKNGACAISSAEDLVQAAIAVKGASADESAIKMGMRDVMRVALRASSQRKPKIIGLSKELLSNEQSLAGMDPILAAMSQQSSDPDVAMADVAYRWFQIWSMDERISGRQLQALELRVLHGMEHKEIAEVLGVSRQAVSKLLDKAKASALQSLADSGEDAVLSSLRAINAKEEEEVAAKREAARLQKQRARAKAKAQA